MLWHNPCSVLDSCLFRLGSGMSEEMLQLSHVLIISSQTLLKEVSLRYSSKVCFRAPMRSTAFDISNLGDWSVSDKNFVLPRTVYHDGLPLKCPQALFSQLAIDPLGFGKLYICTPTWCHSTSGALLLHPRTSHFALLAIFGEHTNWKRKHTASPVRKKKHTASGTDFTQSARTRFKQCALQCNLVRQGFSVFQSTFLQTFNYYFC